MNKAYTERQEQIARFAKAMGHPARMAILQFLASQESCYLKELKEAGLIQGEIEAPKVRYCINRENWETARQLFADFFRQPLCKKEGCCQ